MKLINATKVSTMMVLRHNPPRSGAEGLVPEKLAAGVL